MADLSDRTDGTGGHDGRSRLGVAMLGHAFMGAAHSQAWRNAGRYFDLPVEVDMAVVAGTDPDRAATAAARLGWREATDDWRSVLERPDVDLVDIVTPGDAHAEMAVAALRAGKHVLCEKPLANTVDEAEMMAAAAAVASRHGVHSMVGFNYRRVPAIAYARALVSSGRLGRVHHVRARYLQDWIVDPSFPLVWRLRAERAGSGALGDLGAHIIDVAQFVSGQSITGVSGMTQTFVTERPLATGSAGLQAHSGRGTGPVTVDDAALFLARFDGGAIGSFEATRFAAGRKNSMGFEINGSSGSVAFDFESMNELWFHDHTQPAAEAGFRRILVTEADHPYMAAWWPPGHIIGYEHTFTHQVADLVRALSAGTAPTPSFADGLQVQRVMAAVQHSAADESRRCEVPVLAVDASPTIASPVP